MMKRGKVQDVIFTKQYDWEDADIPFGDLPKDLLDTDMIHYYSDSWDPNTEITIRRERDQTDKEYQETVDWWEKRNKESKAKRYEEYLKLKKEFETEEIDLKEQDNYPNMEDDGWMTDRNHRPD
jgi:hypothetical protein